MRKPKCVVGGVLRSGALCANVIVGGERCGRQGKCRHQRDHCEACGGEWGGVPGNENIIDGKVLCDYCSADRIRASRRAGSDTLKAF